MLRRRRDGTTAFCLTKIDKSLIWEWNLKRKMRRKSMNEKTISRRVAVCVSSVKWRKNFPQTFFPFLDQNKKNFPWLRQNLARIIHRTSFLNVNYEPRTCSILTHIRHLKSQSTNATDEGWIENRKLLRCKHFTKRWELEDSFIHQRQLSDSREQFVNYSTVPRDNDTRNKHQEQISLSASNY